MGERSNSHRTHAGLTSLCARHLPGSGIEWTVRQHGPRARAASHSTACVLCPLAWGACAGACATTRPASTAVLPQGPTIPCLCYHEAHSLVLLLTTYGACCLSRRGGGLRAARRLNRKSCSHTQRNYTLRVTTSSIGHEHSLDPDTNADSIGINSQPLGNYHGHSLNPPTDGLTKTNRCFGKQGGHMKR